MDITDRDNPGKAGQTALLDPGQMDMWDECGGFDMPPFPMPGPGIDGLELLNLCGAIGATPMLLLPACLFMVRRRTRR